MTNHTNTNSTNFMIHKYATKHHHRHSNRYDDVMSNHCRKHPTKNIHNGKKRSIAQQQSLTSNCASQSYSDALSTKSYYSPESGSSQSQSMSSLSPLSINTNSYHSSSNIHVNLSPKHQCFHVYRHYRKYHFSDKQSAKFSLQVFVAMHTTRQLSWFTKHEAWGDKNSLLFKYLDYTFRCAAFRDEVYIFEVITEGTHHNDDEYEYSYDDSGEERDFHNIKSESRLVFNTGLIARQSGNTIYLMLTPNQKKSVAQQWRVGYGDPYNRYNSSFVTDEWLLTNVIPNGIRNKHLLPKQFKLNSDLFNDIKHKFRRNKLQIEADFDHIVTKYWDRIIAEYNKRCALINIPSKEETIKLLKKAFDAVRRDKHKHALLTPMLYVDSHNTQHSVEYMVPLPIHIAVRNNNRNKSHHRDRFETIWFAAALVSRERNHAQLMSILSADMAYSNARLIGAVTTPWLKKLAPLYHKLENQLSHKISPILKVYHICEEDDDKVEDFLFSRFSKYGDIMSVNISLLSSPNENDLNPSNAFSASMQFVNSHSVIDAYNACMDSLNRGVKLGFELDFELIKEMEERESRKKKESSSNYGIGSNYLCQFSQIFCRPHILPPPEQLLSNDDIGSGPFYPMNRINHECWHCYHDRSDRNKDIDKTIKIKIKNKTKTKKVQNEVVVIDNDSNYRMLYRIKHGNEWNALRDSLGSYGINSSYIKCIKRCIKSRNGHDGDHKSTTETTLWYQTSRNLALQIANNGFIFKFMTDFSKLMDTSGFKFEMNPPIASINASNSCSQIHLFQCKLRLTDKQLRYLRHNANIIITDTRIIQPHYWIILCKK